MREKTAAAAAVKALRCAPTLSAALEVLIGVGSEYEHKGVTGSRMAMCPEVFH